jgi:hypothetical protein
MARAVLAIPYVLFYQVRRMSSSITLEIGRIGHVAASASKSESVTFVTKSQKFFRTIYDGESSETLLYPSAA